MLMAQLADTLVASAPCDEAVTPAGTSRPASTRNRLLGSQLVILVSAVRLQAAAPTPNHPSMPVYLMPALMYLPETMGATPPYCCEAPSGSAPSSVA